MTLPAQPTLFDPPAPLAPWRRFAHGRIRPPLARNADPTTSHEAAARALADQERQALAIATALEQFGPEGATARELAAALGAGWDNVIVSRRIAEMRDAGELLTCDHRGANAPPWGHLPIRRREGCCVHVARRWLDARPRAA